jgi:cell division protein FtsQ
MPRWQRRAIWAGFTAVLVAGYLAGVAHLTRSGWIDARLANIGQSLEHAAVGLGFQVGSIRVHGAEKTDIAALRAAIDVARGASMLSLDLPAIRSRVEALPWVRVATVERSLPDTLAVRLAEREPLALLQQDGAVRLIDTTGTTIDGAPLAAFADLPLLAGDGAPAAAPRLLVLLHQSPELAARVTAARHIERRRWDVELDGRVWVKLPQEQALEAWLRLAAEERAHGLLQRDILAIDTRQAEQWFFLLPAGGRVRLAAEAGGR